jgi:hypothetical protein
VKHGEWGGGAVRGTGGRVKIREGKQKGSVKGGVGACGGTQGLSKTGSINITLAM